MIARSDQLISRLTEVFLCPFFPLTSMFSESIKPLLPYSVIFRQSSNSCIRSIETFCDSVNFLTIGHCNSIQSGTCEVLIQKSTDWVTNTSAGHSGDWRISQSNLPQRREWLRHHTQLEGATV